LSEFKVQAVGVILADQPQLVAFADKGYTGPEGYGVKTVMVCVEVGLRGPFRVEYTNVGTQSRCRLVLRSVDGYLFTLPGSCLKFITIHSLCAGHGAAVPASVGYPLGEHLLVDLGMNVVGVLVLSELVVVGR